VRIIKAKEAIMKDDHSKPGAHERSSSAHDETHGPADKDHFLRLMLYKPTIHNDAPGVRPARPAGHYSPLPQSTAKGMVEYYLPHPGATTHVRVDSSAMDVMTDLRKIGAITIGRLTPAEEANQAMITHGVRALFVVDEQRRIVGIITSADIQGEKPVKITHEHGIRHNEVLVRDIMTPADRLEVMDLTDVGYARVGDIVATLRAAGRQHGIVVDHGGGPQTVCGIFSLTQIARQLGIPHQPAHDLGRTFAEIEAALAS
jgi:CBS domain-containing protein